MGYRFGERKYGEGLYSRWPDWWRERNCEDDAWAAQACDQPVWSEIVPPPPPNPVFPWEPVPVTRTAPSGLARPRHARS